MSEEYLDDSAIIFDDNKTQQPVAEDNSEDGAGLYKELDSRLRTQEDKPDAITEVEKLKQQLDEIGFKVDTLESDTDEENEGPNEKEEYLEDGDEISDVDTDIDTKVSVLDTDEAGYLGETEGLGVVRSDNGSITMTRVENPVVVGDDASGIPYKNLEVSFPDDGDELVAVGSGTEARYLGTTASTGAIQSYDGSVAMGTTDGGNAKDLSVVAYVAGQISAIPDSPDVKVASQAGQAAGYLGDVLVCTDTSVAIAVVAGTVTLSVVNYVALQIASIPDQTYLHANLTDSQGGTYTGTPAGSEKQHYHLTNSEYDALTYNNGSIDNADGEHEHAHSKTTGRTTDDHHDKSHAHDGEDGSGTVSYDDLTNKPKIPTIPDHNGLDGKDGGTDTGGVGLDEKEYYHLTDIEYDALTYNNGSINNADGEHTHDLSELEGAVSHNDLSDISGGSSVDDEYYHLTHAEHNTLTSTDDGTVDDADGEHSHNYSNLIGTPPVVDHDKLINVLPDQHHDQEHTHDGTDGSGTVDFEDLDNIPEELQPGGGIVPPDTSDCDQNDYPDPNNPDDPDDGGSYPPIDDDPTDPNNPDNPDDGTSHPSDPDCYSTVPDPIT